MKILITVICSFLLSIHLVLASDRVAAQTISFQEDLNFIQVGFDVWDGETLNTNPQSTNDYIETSKRILMKYKSGNISFKQFKHTKKGFETLVSILEKMLSVYDEAQNHTKSVMDFIDLLDRERVGIRMAMNNSTSFEELQSNVNTAIQNAIQDIKNNGQVDGSIRELQFVYLFKYEWEDVIIKTENEGTPIASGDEYVALSEKMFKQIKDEAVAPSDESLKTAEFVVSRTIDVFKAANHCSKTLEGFLNLVNKHLPLINKAVEEGISLDKSLKIITQKVELASKSSIDEMKSCSNK